MTEEFITDDAFWSLLRKASIYAEMATAIITSRQDLSELLACRAETFMEISQDGSDMAWKHFKIINNDCDTVGLAANKLAKKVFRHD